MDDRKSCPFCGSLNLTWRELYTDATRHIIECKQCLSRGPERKTLEDAEKYWNISTRKRVTSRDKDG